MSSRNVLYLTTIAVLMPASQASANQPPDPRWPFAEDTRFTPIDLLSRYFTDLDRQGRYRTLQPVRTMEGASGKDAVTSINVDPAEPARDIGMVSRAVARSGRLAWGFALADSVLVADRIVPGRGVTDALYVKSAPDFDPMLEGAFMIAAETPVALMVDANLKAGDYYQVWRLVAMRNGRLDAVYGLELFGGTRPERGCAAMIHSQAVDFAPRSTSHFGYSDISMTVTFARQCEGSPKLGPANRTVRFVLRWSVARDGYVGGPLASDALNLIRQGM